MIHETDTNEICAIGVAATEEQNAGEPAGTFWRLRSTIISTIASSEIPSTRHAPSSPYPRSTDSKNHSALAPSIANDATCDTIADVPERLGNELKPEDSLDSQAADPVQPGRIHTFRSLQASGLPDSLTETRVFFSPKMVWKLFSPRTIREYRLFEVNPSLLGKLQMQSVWWQVPESAVLTRARVPGIPTAFQWRTQQ